jgi:hypothetical protein
MRRELYRGLMNISVNSEQAVQSLSYAAHGSNNDLLEIFLDVPDELFPPLFIP